MAKNHLRVRVWRSPDTLNPGLYRWHAACLRCQHIRYAYTAPRWLSAMQWTDNHIKFHQRRSNHESHTSTDILEFNRKRIASDEDETKQFRN